METKFELRRNEFTISTNRARLDLGILHPLLRATHWAREMSREVLERAVANSLCFGLYDGDHLIGFARLITDYCTYAYLTDVVVAAEYRGRGLGKWLTEAIVVHPEMKGLRRITLLTRDAMDLYRQYGFTTDTGSLVYMERRG
jgi:N-acetylglutamate synthase-like GNAT family acetyltransferase